MWIACQSQCCLVVFLVHFEACRYFLIGALIFGALADMLAFQL